MKIRTGFVSNSSSASFTIIWQILSDKEYLPDEAVKSLFEWDGRDEMVKEIQKNTKLLDAKNTFETEFYTIMFNDFRDFGEDAAALLFSLYGRNLTDRCSPETVILKSQIRSEGGW
ncbi:MAG: hypothetical protein M0R80_02525 [Proteobacteria bacterium]|jgi:hypothetical protein|nr:hypothetical protein [Pseudomonadota bacterium]